MLEFINISYPAIMHGENPREYLLDIANTYKNNFKLLNGNSEDYEFYKYIINYSENCICSNCLKNFNINISDDTPKREILKKIFAYYLNKTNIKYIKIINSTININGTNITFYNPSFKIQDLIDSDNEYEIMLELKEKNTLVYYDITDNENDTLLVIPSILKF